MTVAVQAPITQAMVLGAGLGSRMGPLTQKRPKPLVEIAGKALIDHVLDRLVAAGVSRAVVNVHYLADMMDAHLAGRVVPEIIVSDERAVRLETGGGVRKAIVHFSGTPFFIHNSDAIWREDDFADPSGALGGLSNFFDASRMDTAFLLAPVARTLGYDGKGDFDLSEDGHVTRGGYGGAAYVFAGASIAHPRLFDGTAVEAFSLNRVWDKAIAAGRAYGVVLDGLWMHVGTPEAVVAAEQALAAGGGRDATRASNV
ncbi:MAG: nucleotidyltransferase family protein [Pseudomonadota bacterium]